MPETDYIRWFSDIRLSDVPIVGGKNASLVKLYSSLSTEGMRVPNGFALSAAAYRDALTAAKAWEPLRRLLEGSTSGASKLSQSEPPNSRHRLSRDGNEELQAPDRSRLSQARGRIWAQRRRRRAQLGHGGGPAFGELCRPARKLSQRARRGRALFDACRRCFASLFTDRAISYRIDKGFDHFKVALSVGVMKMVRADRAVSGVMFTLDTESGFPRRGVHHRRLWARRKHRAGHGRPGRVLCPQADLPRRAIAPYSAARSAASSCAWSMPGAGAEQKMSRYRRRSATASA